jgi:hypothetical protein
MNEFIQIIADNPAAATAVGVAIAAVLKFFKPIMAAVQSALVRGIDQAWQQHDDEPNVEERVRKTALDLRSNTRFPLPQAFVEERVRKHRRSEPPS